MEFAMKKTLLLSLLMFAFGSIVAANKKMVNDARNGMLGHMGIGWQQQQMPQTAQCIDRHLPDQHVIEMSVAFAKLSKCARGWRGTAFGYKGCRKEAIRFADMFEDTSSAMRNCMNKKN